MSSTVGLQPFVKLFISATILFTLTTATPRLRAKRNSQLSHMLMQIENGQQTQGELVAISLAFNDQDPISQPSRHAAHTANGGNQWMLAGKFQGDIDGINPQGFNHPLPPGVFHNAINTKSAMWPNGVIPYVISTQYKSWERAVLEKAIETYNTQTCIRFVPQTTERDYLDIVKGYGCYSQVGRTQGRQEISLGKGCLYHEIVVHELMHSVGFWHEHSRSDRDQYIQIQYQNIMPGMRGQFDIIAPEYQDLLGLKYDYMSVMHYDSKAFSANGGNTVVTTQQGFTDKIGKATDLSKNDILKISTLYGCPVAQPVTQQPVRTTQQPVNVNVPIRNKGPSSCVDHFLDCPFFTQYCARTSFVLIMQTYCPKTCNYCTDTSSLFLRG